jgi:uncharacterized membrane protein (UPF0127 family)
MTYSQLTFLYEGEKKLLAKSRIAKNALERARGLLFRDMLVREEAMVISKCSAVHTCFMKYPIDIVYVDQDGVIRKIVHNLKPWRFSATLNTVAVIELLAGEAHRKHLRPGIKIEGL